MNQKRIGAIALVLSLLLGLTACGDSGAGDIAEQENASDAAQAELSASEDRQPAEQSQDDPVTILVAAAASLEYSYAQRLIPMFEDKYPHITVEGTYGASGALQTQIEEGLEADVFMSAAMRQMNALKDASLVDADSVVELLENRIVLIAPADAETDISSFEDIVRAQTVALGDVESVPVGQYAREALTSLGIYDQVAARASFGTDVTQVLNWVAEGSADVGVVYATDAAAADKVKVLAEAPDGSLAQKVLYPVGIVTASQNKDAAQLFVDFLQSPEALAVFEQYGFTPNAAE